MEASRREQWNRREQGRSRRTAVQRRSGFTLEKTFHQTGGEKKTQRLTYMNVSRRDARSYKDVLVGKKRLVQGENMGDAVRPHQENDRRCLNEGKAEILVMDDLTKKTIYIPKEAVRWNDLCFVGQIKPMYNLELVQEAFKTDNIPALVCPWFKLLVIIRCQSMEAKDMI
ncbi:hypothetical protein V6N13_093133 [Hibiscus sabdariffa]